MSGPFTLRWGIMATGWISEMFCKDLLTNPLIRNVQDVRHVIAAVGSSSSIASCERFLTSTIKHPDPKPKMYGSYHELVADPDVDIIYVATPHSHHFQNAMLALRAGKHVLCEKAFTVTAAQAKKLVAEAKQRNLFLMEAVWTRYFPLSQQVRALVKSQAVGPVYRVIADLSFASGLSGGMLDFDDGHRMVNPDLAGGALLDIGIYSLTWLMQVLYHCQEGLKEKPSVTAVIQKYHTGVDEATTLVLQFPDHRSMGVGLTSLRVSTGVDSQGTGGPAIRIQGTKGEIQVMGPAYRPLRYRVVTRGDTDDDKTTVEIVDCPIPFDEDRKWGHGLFWEADECARCIRDGKKESETLPWEESVLIMEIMEEALRQGGVKYSDPITSDVYEERGKLNSGGR